jgi:hypothetical protein
MLLSRPSANLRHTTRHAQTFIHMPKLQDAACTANLEKQVPRNPPKTFQDRL